MKRLSLQKVSVLGIVLLAASAVTAAVIPAKEKNDSKERNGAGNLQNSTGSGNVQTCKATEDLVGNCTWTSTVAEFSGTTTIGSVRTLTEAPLVPTANNTTQD